MSDHGPASSPPFNSITQVLGFSGGASGKEPSCQCRGHETRVGSLGREGPLEEEMATHSSILAWRSPWAEEPGGCIDQGVTQSRTRLK